MICVFGAGGDRDRGKRPLMGALAARLADLVFVTSDNPRSEEPEAIIAEILNGVGAGDGSAASAAAGEVLAIADRRVAIGEAVAAGARGDVLVIAGKGHEQGQELARRAQGALRRRRRRPRGPRAAHGDGRRDRLRGWDAPRIAAASGATLLAAGDAAAGPSAVAIDSRAIDGGELFVGLRGERTDGGQHAAAALRAGAWGALIAPAHADAATVAAAEVGAALLCASRTARRAPGARRGMARRARRGRRPGDRDHGLHRQDLDQGHPRGAALHAGADVRRAPANLNTEIGLPLAILGAPAGVRCLVLEMAMRGPGQIAELTAIADPDVGVIVNVGPAHLELLGSLEAIAAAKAELIAGLAPGRTAVLPAGEPLLAPHVRADLHTVTFGEDGEVTLQQMLPDGSVRIRRGAETVELEPSFQEAHNLRNLLAAVAAAASRRGHPARRAAGRLLGRAGTPASAVRRGGPDRRLLQRQPDVDAPQHWSTWRGARPHAASPCSATCSSSGPREWSCTANSVVRAGASGVDVLIAVGPLAALAADTFAGESHRVGDAVAAAELLPGLLHDGDTVLLKASRGVGLEVVVERLRADAAGPTVGVAAAVQDARADEAAALLPGASRGRR